MLPMKYASSAIAEEHIPRAYHSAFQHVLDTYAGETNKVASVWSDFSDSDLSFRPHAKSSTVLEIMKHQLLSERRFFGEFLGSPEPEAAAVLPPVLSVASLRDRVVQLARPRLTFLAERSPAWWLETARFFDAERQHIWIFWRRVLHTAHHRTQLTVYLRLLDKPVPATYGPTADVTWEGADPTLSVETAARKQRP
jgi:uncharacterized damage-inducible protein DinB